MEDIDVTDYRCFENIDDIDVSPPLLLKNGDCSHKYYSNIALKVTLWIYGYIGRVHENCCSVLFRSVLNKLNKFLLRGVRLCA